MGINREIRYETAGTSSGFSQVFFNNYLADSRPVQNAFFSFEKPMFYTYGGTLDYYGQDPYSIYTNLVRPPIRFVFSANTNSLSGDCYFIHEIYKLDYTTHKLYSDNQIDLPIIISNKTDSSNILINSDPAKKNSPSREITTDSKISSGNNTITQPEKFLGQPLTKNDKATIQKYFSNPILVFTASTSGITGNVYDLYLEQYIKQLGSYKLELFSDKGQYLINTKIAFNINLNKKYVSFLNNDINLVETQEQWNNTLKLTATNSEVHKIINGPYAGLDVVGNFFTYFVVPDKPKLEYPIMQGQLSTFTPEFRWSNGDNADSFLVQINYNITDTGFTGTIFNYPVEKNEKNSKLSKSIQKGFLEDFSTDKNIYTFQLPMKSNKSFIYRVGNSKEIIDIFNIRRNVITFTDYYSAISQSEPIKTYVFIESDSKYKSEITGLFTPPSLDYESEISAYSLSGIISGSTITGATIQLIYPNSNFITTMTDVVGAYSFSGLGTGYYTLITNYRGYKQDIRTINITGDTSENFKIKLMWSNDVDTWGKLAGESYYT